MFKRIVGGFANLKNIRFIFMLATLSYLGDFAIRFVNKYDNLTLQYKDFEAKYTDCKKNLPSFIDECRRITHYLSKPIYIRTMMDVISETKLCGTYTCMDYFFGPDLSFAFVGQVVKITTIVIAVWLIVIIVDYLYKILNNHRKSQNKIDSNYNSRRIQNAPFYAEDKPHVIFDTDGSQKFIKQPIQVNLPIKNVPQIEYADQ